MPDKRVHGSRIVRARLVTPAAPLPAKLRSGSPALEVMTDLTDEAAHVVTPDQQIDLALNDMIRYGVRLLLVARDSDVVGIITSYDIMGERPIQFLEGTFGTGTTMRHSEIKVADIMTPLPETYPLHFNWVRLATVGDIAAVFHEDRATHLLVLDHDGAGGHFAVRGIFSRTRLERHFGPLA